MLLLIVLVMKNKMKNECLPKRAETLKTREPWFGIVSVSLQLPARADGMHAMRIARGAHLSSPLRRKNEDEPVGFSITTRERESEFRMLDQTDLVELWTKHYTDYFFRWEQAQFCFSPP